MIYKPENSSSHFMNEFLVIRLGFMKTQQAHSSITSNKELAAKTVDQLQTLLKKYQICPIRTADALFFMADCNMFLNRFTEAVENLHEGLRIVNKYRKYVLFLIPRAKRYFDLAITEHQLAKEAQDSQQYSDVNIHMYAYEDNLRIASSLGFLLAKWHLFTYLLTSANDFMRRKAWGKNDPSRFQTEGMKLGKEVLAHTPEEIGIDKSTFKLSQSLIDNIENEKEKLHKLFSPFVDLVDKVLSDPDVPKEQKEKITEKIELLNSVLWVNSL